MADVLSGNVRSLQETLRSKSPHRGQQAAQLSSDLYQQCIESVSDTELGIISLRSNDAYIAVGCEYVVIIVKVVNNKTYFFAAYCSSVLFDKSSGILVFLRESVTLDEVYTLRSDCFL